MSAVVIKDAGPFRELYSLPRDINVVVCIGGRGGRKTYEVSKFCAKSATIDRKRIVVLRDVKETIRESILNEIFLRYDTANQYGHFDGLFDKTERGIRDLETGEMLVFTKGFTANSKQKTANLKSISDVDIAVIEEAEDIRDPNKFNTFADSIRKKGSLIIIILNTPDINHWIVKRFFHLEAEKDENGSGTGYFKLIPRDMPGFKCIQTSYKDNPYLPEEVVRRYESYGDPNSTLYDEHYYKTAILGLASTGRRGQILTNVAKIKLEDYLALPYREVYGQDFGTTSPAGLVGVKMHGDNVWARQLNYTGLDTLGIAKLYCKLGFTQRDIIIADSAEPITINTLRNGFRRDEISAEDAEKFPQVLKGFYILASQKGPGSILSGIGMLKGKKIHIVEESTDFWHEIYNYIYAVDRNMNPTDEPADEFNHLIDPLRYVVMAKGKLWS